MPSDTNEKSTGLTRGRAVLLICVTIVSLVLAAGIRLDEDALALLPGEGVRSDLKLLQKLGMVNRLFISFELGGDLSAVGDQRQRLADCIKAVGGTLEDDPLFEEVFYHLPDGYERQFAGVLRDFMPALSGPEDLARIRQRLTAESMRELLRQDYLTLNSPSGFPLAGMIRSDPFHFTGLLLEKLKGLRGGMRLELWKGFFISADQRHGLLWLETRDPLTRGDTARLVEKSIDSALAAGLTGGVKARVIGPMAHTLANSRTIKADLARLLPAAMLVLTLFLLLAFRDWRAFLVVSVPFMAIPPAVAVVRLFYDSLSAMALGFGIVLLGIAVDFSIHMHVALSRGTGLTARLKRSILLAAATTLGVFGVLLMSKVPVHRQMALLAMGGISWSLLLTWWIIPSLVRRAEPVEKASCETAAFGLAPGPGWLRAIKIVCWLLLLLGGLMSWSGLRYNGDLKNLDVPVASIQRDESAFKKVWGGEVESAFIVAARKTAEASLDLNDQVYFMLKQEGAREFQSLSPLMPGPVRQRENLGDWKEFQADSLGYLVNELPLAAVDSGFTKGAFVPFLAWLSTPPRMLSPKVILKGSLRPLLHSLYRADDDGGGGLVATIVPETPDNLRILETLGRAIPEVRIISGSRWRRQVEELLRSDIVRLSLAASCLILLICWLIFKSIRLVIASLAPVLSALAAMALFEFLTGGYLGFMHVLMGIMVIGLSVDYGIFAVRSRGGGSSSATFMAVSICAVSTLSGFGVLAFARHPALHALGTTVLAGIGAAWPTALLVTPALLPGNREEGRCG